MSEIEGLPRRFTAYKELLGLYQDIVAEYFSRYEKIHGRIHNRTVDTLSYVPYLGENIVQEELPSIGADSFSLFMIGLDKARYGSDRDNLLEEHKLIVVELKTFKGGKPYISEYDTDIDDMGNFHRTLFGVELEPVITHDSTFGTPGIITPERLALGRKVNLTDKECGSLIDSLKNSMDEIDTSEAHYG